MTVPTILLAAGAALMQASAGERVPVIVEVNGLSVGRGQVLVGICTEREFLTPTCTYQTVVKVGADRHVRVRTAVPPGRYAVQVVYDLNGNFQMDSNALNMPLEPVGFSRNATASQAPPRFADAAVDIEQRTGLIVTVQ